MDRTRWLSLLPTGQKIFLIIAAALAPLAFITLFANLRSASVADSERRALVNVAAREAAHKLAATFLTDEDIVKRPLRVSPITTMMPIERMEICEAVKRALVVGKEGAPEVSFYAAASRMDLCSNSISVDDRAREGLNFQRGGYLLDAEQALLRETILTQDAAGQSVLVALTYPKALLEQIAEPTAPLPPYTLTLEAGDTRLPIADTLGSYIPGAALTATAPVTRGNLVIGVTTMRRSASTSDIISVLTPILMWLLAAGLGWVLINYLLLRPLRRLDQTLQSYEPGQILPARRHNNVEAREISALEQAIAQLSTEVAEDKQVLRQLYDHQVVLTREVHHRVKNNLQIIASLLNIHSRSAPTVEAEEAYQSIQRRVDALAVVHRNHYADLEENDGIALRPLIDELAIGFRSVMHGRRDGLTVRADPVNVEQDIAIPVAFLVTEFTELALGVNADNAIEIRIDANDKMARLSMISPSYIANTAHDDLWTGRFGRVINGLARQLRRKLHYDPTAGRYDIDFPIL